MEIATFHPLHELPYRSPLDSPDNLDCRAGALALLAFAFSKPPPQDLPWTGLDLAEPIGFFTARKLTRLTDAGSRCFSLLRAAGVRFRELPTSGGQQCKVINAARLQPGQQMLSLEPAAVTPSCPMLAGMLIWQTQVLQPLSQSVFGKSVSRIEHLGSYSCRRLYGRSSGAWSEHATANAIDISGFVLSDGTHVSIVRDWHSVNDRGMFLHAARDGACRLFSTVLSPDYNAAHRDHLHIDLARRGELGWQACR
jgi:hypothetical protein